MSTLQEKIKQLKPNLKESSINLYITNLKKIYREIECNGRKEQICNFDNLNFLNDYERVMQTLEDENANTKKNRLIAIVVSLQATKANPKLIEKYTKEMIELAEQSNKNIRSKRRLRNKKKIGLIMKT
jgi:hypothetical protein